MDDALQVNINLRVNLDHLFAFETVKSLSEPTTPYRLAIYFLMRCLNTEIVEKSCSGENHARICALLYGLLEREEEMTFAELCRIIHVRINPILRKFLDNYLKFIREAIENDGCKLVWEPLGLKRGLIANKSHFEHFVQRLVATERLKSFNQHGLLLQRFRAYIRGEDLQRDVELREIRHMKGLATPPPALPRCISTGSYARLWVMKQMHLQQVAPLEVDPNIDTYCGLIATSFHDLPAVHLLLVLRALNRRDQPTAINELRAFFDYSVIRPNDLTPITIGKNMRLVTLDTRIVRYAPLLTARIYRMFGDKNMARRLLAETIAQAQCNKERTCLRLALIELAIAETLPDKKELTREEREEEEAKKESIKKNKKKDLLQGLTEDLSGLTVLSANTLQSFLVRTQQEDNDAVTEGENRRELNIDPVEYRHMVERYTICGNLVAAMTAFLRCDNYAESDDAAVSPVQDAILAASSISTGMDAMGKSREFANAAASFTAVVRLHAGFTSSAIAHARALHECDLSDMYSARRDTEAKAVAGITMAFGYATEGKWSRAMEMVGALEQRYCREGANPICGRHVQGAAALIRFDEAFMRGEWQLAEERLSAVHVAHPAEAVLRRALLLGMTGNLSESIQLLRTARATTSEVWDLPTSTRMDMQLAVLMARCGEAEEALHILAKSHGMCKSRGQTRLLAMVQRREALIKMQIGMVKNLRKTLLEFEPDIQSLCGPLERTLHCLTLAELAHYERNMERKEGGVKAIDEVDPNLNPEVALLGKARALAEQIGCPMLEKSALAMSARILNKGPLLARIASRIKTLNEKTSTTIDWTLL